MFILFFLNLFSFFLFLFFQVASGSKLVSGGMRKNPTLICVPIMGESVDKMVVDMGKANASGADLVEIRLDGLKNFNPRENIKTLIKESPVPTLFTYRFVIEFLLLYLFCYVFFTLYSKLEYLFNLSCDGSSPWMLKVNAPGMV